MSNCTRRKNQDDKEEAAASSSEPHHALSESSSSPLIKFLLDSTKQLQDEKADILPVLRGIVRNCPKAVLTGDEAKNYEEAAIDAVFDLSRVLLDLVTTKRGPVSQVASLALFNIIPAVGGVKKCVQFVVSTTSALGNMYTKHWSNGMIHWGKAPNYENLNESTDCFARLQRMHYLMRILNCRKDMLEQQTNMLKDQLKKHQMNLAGPSRARSKRRYHKREMVSAEDFHTFKSSLKKEPEDLAKCLQKMKMDPYGKRYKHPGDCSGVDSEFFVKFKTVEAPDILLDIFESLFEDPYMVIRKEFNWNEENVVAQRFWHSIYIQLHLVHGAMESPYAVEIFADSYEEWSTFSCFFNVIEGALLCPSTRTHPLALKNLHGWFDMCTKYTKAPMKMHNIRLADDVVGGIQRTMLILNSSVWDSATFAKMFQLQNLAKTSFANIKNRVEHPNILTFDWTEMALRELPWKNKRKLQILAEIIPEWQDHEIKRVTKKRGIFGFAANIVECLEFNELRSACGDVFKAVLERFSKEQFTREFVPVIEASFLNKNYHAGLSNYWLPALVKKYPDVASSLDVPNLAGSIMLLKVQRKEITELLLLKDKEGESLLLRGLHAFDIEMRTRAVSALCQGVNAQANWLASTDVLEKNISLVREFVEDNITVASQASRNIITKCLSSFFVNLRDYLLHILKICKKSKGVVLLNETAATSSVIQFFVWIGNFIHNRMDLGYSYQRNLFTLQIFENLLSTFSPSEKNLKLKTANLVTLMKSQGGFFLHSSTMLKAALKCVLSPDQDVRLLASKIILENEDFDKSTMSFDEISKDAHRLCSARNFYVIEGGALLFKTVAQINKVPAQLSVQTLYQTAQEEFDFLKKSLLKAVMENRPVYGCLQGLIFILQNETEIGLESLKKALSLTEEVSEHFLRVLTSKSSTQEFAPSFEDMDWAIEAEINENYTLDNKSLHLTPEFQYSLSCAWLNLKTCTELACCVGNIIATKYSTNEQLLRRCSVVIMNVLQKTRHKGAFEAAGVALGSFVKKLTTIGSTLPRKMLDKLMSTLNLTGSDAPPLSRRSAGLAVAIHKIVTSDVDPEKELLHDTFDRLLLPTEESADECCEKKPGLFDDVKTRKMHVLYILVSDGGISQHVNCHLESIGQMAIYYLNANDWGIKNAAMQLFGAFVKKMTTQRKSRSSTDDDADFDEDTDWDIAGNGLLEDLLIRSSYLVTQIVSIIKYPVEGADFDQFSQMDPCCNPPDENAISCALGFLQCLTTGPFSLWTKPQSALVKDIGYYCCKLLGHPSWLVRKQAAKCTAVLTNRCSYTALLKCILKEMDDADANKFHGLFMLNAMIKKKINFFRDDKKKLEGVMKDLDAKITAKLLEDINNKEQRSSFLLYKFASLENLQKEEIVKLLLNIAEKEDMGQVQTYCQMLFASDLVEHVVLHQHDWIPEILALVCSFESMHSVQQHLLQCLPKSAEISAATEEQLEICLSYKMSQNSNKHELVCFLKPLIARKRKVRDSLLTNLGDGSIWQLHLATTEMNLQPNLNICDQLIQALSSSQRSGDEFESLALSLIAHIVFECVAIGSLDAGLKLLPVLSQFMVGYLDDENMLSIAVVGPALNIIGPIIWNLHVQSKSQQISLVGIKFLRITTALLLENDFEAVKSIWPLRTPKTLVCEMNPSICLRKIHLLAADTLTTVESLEQYLWDTLRFSGIMAYHEDLSSPFIHLDDVELGCFEFTEAAFEHIYNMTGSKMTNNGMPSSTEIEKNYGDLINSVIMYKTSCGGELQQTHPGLIVALRKFEVTVTVLRRFYDRDHTKKMETITKELKC